MYCRNFLTQLQRLKILTICHRQAGNPRKLPVSLNPSPRPENSGPDLSLKASELVTPISKGRGWWVSPLEQRVSSLPLSCSAQTLSGLDDVHSRWQEHLLSALIQKLLFSRNILIDIPRNVLQDGWASLSPVKLTPKTKHPGGPFSPQISCSS